MEETENGLVGEFNIVLNEEVSAVSVDNNPFSLSKRFSLHKVYPNPSNNSIKIDFIINNFGYVDIGIYDITGKWVSNLVGEKMHRGKYNVVWNGDNMLGKTVASGIYLVMMKFGGSIQTKKIKLIK